MSEKSVGVIGGGAWGTGLSQALARGNHKVQIWALEDEVVESINKEHENKKFLPGYKLSDKITCSKDIIEVATGKEFLIIASPSLFLAKTFQQYTNIIQTINFELLKMKASQNSPPAPYVPKLQIS